MVAEPPELSEDDAEALLAALRWPAGWICPFCGHEGCYALRLTTVRRRRYKCRRCRRQSSVTRGTILDGSKVPLSVWVRAVRLLCATPEALGAAMLARRLGIGRTRARNLLDRLSYAARREPLAALVGRSTAEAGMDDVPFAGLDAEAALAALLRTPAPNSPTHATDPHSW